METTDSRYPYETVRAALYAQADETYRQFNERLLPPGTNTIGVRVPALRKLARTILKEDWRAYLAAAQDDTHEEILLQGIVTFLAKCPLEEKCLYAAAYIPKISNWALCDIACGCWKDAKQSPDEVLNFIDSYLFSPLEYEARFAAVMLMNGFLTDESIDHVLDAYSSIRAEGYYAKMAVAWGLSICFVKYREKTLALLERRRLDPFIQNKTIQKIRESKRVSKEDKAMLLFYKLPSSV